MPENFEIRVEEPGDYAGVSSVHDLAFKRPDEGILVEKIRKSDTFIPELSFVAVAGNQIVGHVIFSRVYIDAASGSKPVLALAPLAVHPEYQGKGVGTKLTNAGIKKAKQLGWRAMIVLGQPTYYPRFGFEPATEYGIECPFPLNDPNAFMAMELHDEGLDDASGTVVYPSFFSELD